jgi:DNA-binding response OmpR family regulator
MGRILITDDNADIRHLVSALLAEEGHKVVVANDGGKALELMASDEPELLVLDIMMPRVDGYAVLAQMDELGLSDRVKILMLTAKTSESDWVRGYKLGADGYLTKPFLTDELIEVVAEMLATSKEELEKHREAELDKAQLLSRLESIFQF